MPGSTNNPRSSDKHRSSHSKGGRERQRSSETNDNTGDRDGRRERDRERPQADPGAKVVRRITHTAYEFPDLKAALPQRSSGNSYSASPDKIRSPSRRISQPRPFPETTVYAPQGTFYNPTRPVPTNTYDLRGPPGQSERTTPADPLLYHSPRRNSKGEYTTPEPFSPTRSHRRRSKQHSTSPEALSPPRRTSLKVDNSRQDVLPYPAQRYVVSSSQQNNVVNQSRVADSLRPRAPTRNYQLLTLLDLNWDWLLELRNTVEVLPDPYRAAFCYTSHELFKTHEVRAWKAATHSSILIVNGNGHAGPPDQNNVTPVSRFSMDVIHRVSTKYTEFAVLHWCCSFRDTQDSGGLMLRYLIGQIICHPSSESMVLKLPLKAVRVKDKADPIEFMQLLETMDTALTWLLERSHVLIVVDMVSNYESLEPKDIYVRAILSKLAEIADDTSGKWKYPLRLLITHERQFKPLDQGKEITRILTVPGDVLKTSYDMIYGV